MRHSLFHQVTRSLGRVGRKTRKYRAVGGERRQTCSSCSKEEKFPFLFSSRKFPRALAATRKKMNRVEPIVVRLQLSQLLRKPCVKTFQFNMAVRLFSIERPLDRDECTYISSFFEKKKKIPNFSTNNKDERDRNRGGTRKLSEFWDRRILKG